MPTPNSSVLIKYYSSTIVDVNINVETRLDFPGDKTPFTHSGKAFSDKPFRGTTWIDAYDCIIKDRFSAYATNLCHAMGL